MNICFLVGRLYKNGGIGRAVSVLANSLCNQEDLKIHLLCYCDYKKPNFYQIDSKIQQNFLLDQHCTMKVAMLKGAHKKLRNYIKKNDIDIIVACGVLYFPISVLASRKTKAKCICWEHCHLGNSNDIDFENICRRIGAKKADRVVTLTKHDEKEYKSYYNISHVSQIYNAMDPVLTLSNNYNPDTNRIASVGRLTYPKYFEKAVEVAALVLPKFPEYTWSIYGNGEDEEKLKSLIKQANLEGRLILEGQVNNIYDLYNEHSLLVMTSRYEGFPMVLLEGLGKNLPLVAFDVLTGPNEIIHDGENGYLIEPFDTQKMAEKICEILSDRNLRIKMSENCKKYAGQFELSSIADSWKKIFVQLTKS